MCGIAGSINHALNIERLTCDLLHRGPDEQATFRENNVILHHHRLAILDISGGKQPMSYGRYTIIFNGEIYNHLEVRKNFNLNCQTNSDTETILHAYAAKGPECLEAMDGMFAFTIFDNQTNNLFIARDRAGKKPLYYYQHNGQFVFASELNSLHGQLELQINEQHIRQFLRMGYFYKSYTPYHHVYELPAGSYAIVNGRTTEIAITKWWNIRDYYDQPSTDSLEVAQQKVDEILHRAIQTRIDSSDLEVGSFLSGGIDSGLVTAIASQYKEQLKTFTVSFDGAFDEAPLAKLVAERYNTQHYEIRISFDNLINDIEKILTNYGEPFYDSSAVPSYYVSKEAKKHLTVILNGDGGDEIFGGYRRYVPFANYDFFKSGRALRSAAGLLHSILPNPKNKKSKYNYIYRLADLAQKDNLNMYLSSSTDIFEGYEEYLGEESYLKDVAIDFNNINNSHLTGLQKMLNLDFDNILAGVLLVKMDIATMANSLEGRSPLLSKELLEYVPGLADGHKIKGTQTKHLLRRLATKYLPEELINQPKRGFEPPQKAWVNNELKEIFSDYIHSSNPYYENYIDKAFVRKLMDDKIAMPSEKRSKILWILFALEVWYKKVYIKSTTV